MIKKNKILGMYGLAFAAMMTDPMQSNRVDWEDMKSNKAIIPVETNPNKQALNKPCPNGCKTYFFNSRGEFETGRMKKDECVFVCHASNDRNAIRKFKKLYDPTLNVTPS